MAIKVEKTGIDMDTGENYYAVRCNASELEKLHTILCKVSDPVAMNNEDKTTAYEIAIAINYELANNGD